MGTPPDTLSRLMTVYDAELNALKLRITALEAEVVQMRHLFNKYAAYAIGVGTVVSTVLSTLIDKFHIELGG